MSLRSSPLLTHFLVAVFPKDRYGNPKDDSSVTDVFLISGIDSFGAPVFNTSSVTAFGSTVSSLKYATAALDFANKAGKYIVQATMNGVLVAGSPQSLTIAPAVYESSKTAVNAESKGLYDPTEVEQEFLISLYDTYDNFITADQTHLDKLRIKWYRPNRNIIGEEDEITTDFTNFTKSVADNGDISVKFVDTESNSKNLAAQLASWL